MEQNTEQVPTSEQKRVDKSERSNIGLKTSTKELLDSVITKMSGGNEFLAEHISYDAAIQELCRTYKVV